MRPVTSSRRQPRPDPLPSGPLVGWRVPPPTPLAVAHAVVLVEPAPGLRFLAARCGARRAPAGAWFDVPSAVRCVACERLGGVP